MSDAIRKVVVDLGERRYDILVGAGLIADAGTHLKPLLRRARIAVVTDETVARLHLPALQESLDVAGIHHDTIVLPQGESTKSFAQLEKLTEWLLETGIELEEGAGAALAVGLVKSALAVHGGMATRAQL